MGALVAYYAKYFDAASALELRQLFISYDRTLLIADPRRCEPKKFGGQGARARRQSRTVKYSSCDMWNPVHVRFSAALDCSCTTAIMKLTSLLLLHNSPICALLVQTVTWNSTWRIKCSLS